MTLPARFLTATVLVALASTTANATIFDMSVFHNGRGVDTSGLNIWVDVVDRGSHVDFQFHNDSAISSSVTQFYFEDFSDYLSNGYILDQSSSADMRNNYNYGASPHSAIGDWNGTQFRARARYNSTSNGIRQGEFLTVRFSYDQSNYQSLLGAIYDGRLDLAQQVKGVYGETVWMSQRTGGGGGTDPVPLPASVWLLGSGFATWLGGRGVKKRLSRS